jgi:hypothetical protein
MFHRSFICTLSDAKLSVESEANVMDGNQIVERAFVVKIVFHRAMQYLTQIGNKKS